jgi:hypothetical protein
MWTSGGCLRSHKEPFRDWRGARLRSGAGAPRLRELRADPEVGGSAEDALDDIQQFMGTDG